MTTIVHPVILNIDPNLDMNGGPMFSSEITQPLSGETGTAANWDEALWEWTIRFVRESKDFSKALGFYLARKGPAFGWEFYDPFDNRDDDNEGIGMVKTFADSKRYLCKKYPDVDDYNPYYRKIKLASNISYTGVSGTPLYDEETGEITGADSDGLATFDFLNPVVFMTDMMKIARDAATGEWADVTVRELRKFEVAT